MTGAWVVRPKPSPLARLRLFCFPWAGVGAAVYRSWPAALSADVEVCAVRPPGRESRFREPPYTDLLQLAEAAAEGIRPYLTVPFALFGHSLGASVAFEITRYLHRTADALPVHLFVSGRRPPRLPSRDADMHALPDDEFVAEICRRYGGIPDQVLHDRELLALLLPCLRADITAVETYGYSAGEPLACPMSVFGGTEDPRVPLDELEGWRQETTGPFTVELLPGDHFFVESARPRLLRALSIALAPAVPAFARVGGDRQPGPARRPVWRPSWA
jgi:surfactin synthase thioesterase subunit